MDFLLTEKGDRIHHTSQPSGYPTIADDLLLETSSSLYTTGRYPNKYERFLRQEAKRRGSNRGYVR